MECGKIRTLAAFLTEYFVLLKFDDHTRFRLKFPLHYSGKNRWQSLVPHFKESVGSYTASTYWKLLIQFQRITISLTNYWEDILVNEQKTVFRHYGTVSIHRQLAAKKMLQWDRSYSQDTASLFRQPSALRGGSRSLLRIPGLGIADGILVQPPDLGSRCYMQAPMRPDAGVRSI